LAGLALVAFDASSNYAGSSSFAVEAATFGDTESFVDIAFDIGATADLYPAFNAAEFVELGIQSDGGDPQGSVHTIELLLDSIH
jgi:hypothetical protein